MNTFSFNEFQTKFLKSVLLMNHLGNEMQMQHDLAARHGTALTEVFLTHDNVRVQVHGEMVKRGHEYYPEFRLSKIKQ